MDGRQNAPGLSEFLRVETYTARKGQEHVWQRTTQKEFSKELLDQLVAGSDPQTGWIPGV
jgi:hypothetical protein